MGIVFRIARICLACGDGSNFEEIDMTVSMVKKYVTRDGLYNAKVIYIHDKGDQPVIVLAEYKRDLASNTVFRTQLNGKVWHDAENGFDLIEVPEENPAPTLDDYYDAFVYVWNPAPTVEKGHREGIKAVLELAGVKV